MLQTPAQGRDAWMKFNPASTSILYHSSPPHYHPQLDGERALPTTVKAWQDRGPQRSQGRGAGDGAELPQLPQTMDWQSHALGGNKTTGNSLSSGRALRAAPRAAGALPQGLCTGGRVDSSPLSAILLEKCSFFQYPSLLQAQLPQRPHMLSVLCHLANPCQTCSCPGTPQNDYGPPFPLLKCSGVPTVSPHSWSPWHQNCRSPNSTAPPLCSDSGGLSSAGPQSTSSPH